MEQLNEALLDNIADLVRELNLMKENAELIRRIIAEEEAAGEDASLIAGARATLANITEIAGALEETIAMIEEESNPAPDKSS